MFTAGTAVRTDSQEKRRQLNFARTMREKMLKRHREELEAQDEKIRQLDVRYNDALQAA